MYAYPGKKLMFMGGEFGQEREWNHDASLDWHLLEQPRHAGVQQLVRDLNRLYRDSPVLYEVDFDPWGFEWIDCSDNQQGVISFQRHARDSADIVVVVCNMTPVPRHDYRIGAPRAGDYVELINSDADCYGGSGIGNLGRVRTEPVSTHGHEQSLKLNLPPLATLILKPV